LFKHNLHVLSGMENVVSECSRRVLKWLGMAHH